MPIMRTRISFEKGWIIEVDDLEGANCNIICRYHLITRKHCKCHGSHQIEYPGSSYWQPSMLHNWSKRWSYWRPGSSIMITLITRVLPLDPIRIITLKSSLASTFYSIGFSVEWRHLSSLCVLVLMVAGEGGHDVGEGEWFYGDLVLSDLITECITHNYLAGMSLPSHNKPP